MEEIQELGESTKTDTISMEGEVASCSSSSPPARRVYVGKCSICTTLTTSQVIADVCLHAFCVKCFLQLWTQEELGQPCICPSDGKQIISILPGTPNLTEEMNSLATIYNRLFYIPPRPLPPGIVRFMAENNIGHNHISHNNNIAQNNHIAQNNNIARPKRGIFAAAGRSMLGKLMLVESTLAVIGTIAYFIHNLPIDQP